MLAFSNNCTYIYALASSENVYRSRCGWSLRPRKLWLLQIRLFLVYSLFLRRALQSTRFIPTHQIKLPPVGLRIKSPGLFFVSFPPLPLSFKDLKGLGLCSSSIAWTVASGACFGSLPSLLMPKLFSKVSRSLVKVCSCSVTPKAVHFWLKETTCSIRATGISNSYLSTIWRYWEGCVTQVNSKLIYGAGTIWRPISSGSLDTGTSHATADAAARPATCDAKKSSKEMVSAITWVCTISLLSNIPHSTPLTLFS